MSDKQTSFECAFICWAIAALVGIVSMVMLYMMADFSALQAIFTGGLIGTVLGIVLSLFICRRQTAAADLASDEKPAQRYAREAAEDQARRSGGTAAGGASAAAGGDAAAAAGTAAGSSTASSATAASASAAEAPAASPAASSTPAAAMGSAGAAAAASAPAVKASAKLPGEEEVASQSGKWRYEGGDEAPAAKKAPAKKAPAKKAAAKKPAAKKAAAAPAADTADVAEAKPATLYDAPPAEGADDLKLISGVGPKLEQTLNELGVYRFAQVAAWGPSDIAWVDNRLRFKGRITRDDWMSQAKILAEGGETEFSSRKKK